MGSFVTSTMLIIRVFSSTLSFGAVRRVCALDPIGLLLGRPVHVSGIAKYVGAVLEGADVASGFAFRQRNLHRKRTSGSRRRRLGTGLAVGVIAPSVHLAGDAQRHRVGVSATDLNNATTVVVIRRVRIFSHHYRKVQRGKKAISLLTSYQLLQ